MTMPDWWSERRFGVCVHAAASSVPGWAPLGEDAGRYRSHLGGGVADGAGSSRPLVEVLAHHRDRWGHVDAYDDFVPLLAFDRFDPDEWTELVSDSGAGYTVLVAKHHDGWAWWDAPGTSRRLTELGPRRNLLAEYAGACERSGLTWGASYSLLDPSDARNLAGALVEHELHPQVVDLVDRYRPAMLRAEGHGTHDGRRFELAQLLGLVRTIRPEIVVNDRWGASDADVPAGAPSIVRTFEYDPPDEITTGPWELSRGIGHSLGYNRAERDAHHLTGSEIVALYTEVLAKGGNLLLGVGPDSSGVVPAMQATPLRDAGSWIGRHGATLAATTPWTTWGDSDVRYLCDGGDLIVVDVSGAGRFPALDVASWRVTALRPLDDDVPEPIWSQDATGLHVTAPTGATTGPVDIAAYRIAVVPADRPDGLFTPVAAAPIALGPLVEEAMPSGLVQLGDGVYEGPATIPPGVVLRGLGADRTTIISSRASGAPSLSLGRDARVEHVGVGRRETSGEIGAGPVVRVHGDSATLLGCTIDGAIEVDADDVLVRAVASRSLIARNADRLHVSRCTFGGALGEVGIELRGGGGQELDSNRLSGYGCAIRVSGTTGTTVRGNTLSARWSGVHVDHCESAHVHGNRISWTMRAVDVDGGTQAVVDGNAVTDGDSGCIVGDGASDCEVYGNHWDRCRVGLIAWDAVALHHQDNICSDLHEPAGAVVTGPERAENSPASVQLA
jgi:alpha-L-fucosidase